MLYLSKCSNPFVKIQLSALEFLQILFTFTASDIGRFLTNFQHNIAGAEAELGRLLSEASNFSQEVTRAIAKDNVERT